MTLNWFCRGWGAPMFEELAYKNTDLGRLSLRRRRDLLLGGVEVFEVKLGDEFLMSSLFHEAEVELAHLGLAASPGDDDLNVMVGGLGLGYTAAAALQDPRLKGLWIVESMAEVIRWHRESLVPLGASLKDDERVTFVRDDFFKLADADTGFAVENAPAKFDTILLDIDHSPSHFLDPAHSRFYTVDGLKKLTRHLKPGGVFAMWSNDPPEAQFSSLLDEVFAESEAKIVQFDNPYQKRKASATIYISTYGP